MPFKLVRDDITRIHADAIVCPTDIWLSGSGGTDYAIHKAAGNPVDHKAKSLAPIHPGQAVLTRAGKLSARYIIHTAGPVWKENQSSHDEEIKILENCYKNSLQLARKKHLNSVAFPLIAAGQFGFPKEQAFDIAMKQIQDFLVSEKNHSEMMIYLVVYDPESFRISQDLYADIESFIDERYIEEHEYSRPLRSRPAAMEYTSAARPPEDEDMLSLEEALMHVQAGFSDLLLKKIDEKGISDADCYKKANVDRRLFSKIRSNPEYRPSKQTVLAFAIALELSLDETDQLLKSAGFALSPSSKFDIIIEYFIRHHEYDIFAINEALFVFGQGQLG